MSEVYSLEPSTRGRIIIHTTLGELDIRLWSIQCPKACRNFTQLCIEGYYNNCIFHRLVKNFLIQTGDPTGSGLGGESIYGSSFENEYHPRLRFRYRGLVGMANDGTKSSNRSQFFITLDRADCLNDKYTLFGKVGGHTLYNVIKIGSIENDKNDRPINPPKIIRTEVIENAFNDIIPRLLEFDNEDEEEEIVVQKSIRNKSLLSFDDEPIIKLNKKKKFDANFNELNATTSEPHNLDISKPHNHNMSKPHNHNTLDVTTSSKYDDIILKDKINSLKDEIRGIISSEKKENNTQKYTKNKHKSKENTMEKFDNFMKKLKTIAKNAVDRESDDPNDNYADGSWLSGDGLTFSIDSNRAYDLDASRDTLKVIDPLQSSDNKLEELRKIGNQRLKPSLARNKPLEKW